MKLTLKLVSLLLCIVLMFSICACNMPPATENPPNNNDTSNDATNDGTTDKPGADEIVMASTMVLSKNSQDYIGDLETFVYGLLINRLEYIYDVFPAYVQLSDSYFVYGLAYTDYTEVYVNDDESIEYFKTGFLPFIGEIEVPQEDFDAGLYINNIDCPSEETKFIWTYKSEGFLEHCVIYGVYLQYGVSDRGEIVYNATAFEREKCDTSLGSLYSYDESRYLYDVDFGEYLPIGGATLSETFDFEEFEKEINAYIEQQNQNWYTYDVETVAYVAQEAVKFYLLSLQDETFLGYPVEGLVQLSEELNPLECFRVGPDGLSILDIEEIPPEQPTPLVKWLVGSACAIATAVGMVGSLVTSLCPPLSAVISGLTGVAIETFMQIVIENKTLDTISWTRVAIAAASGAVSGFIGPYLQVISGASYFIIDTAVDGIISATEQAIFAWMDGASGKEMLTRIGFGFALGAGLSAGFKTIGAGITALSATIAKSSQKTAQKLSSKLTSTTAKFSEPTNKNIGNSIGNFINQLKAKADNSPFSSKFIKNKINQQSKETLATVVNETLRNNNDLTSSSLKSMRVADMFDMNGNPINKKQLLEIYNNSSNGSRIGKYTIQIEDAVEDVYIVKNNSTFGVEFDGKYSNVTLPNGLTSDRSTNFINAARELCETQWSQNPSRIPLEIQSELLKKYPGRTIDEILEFADVDELSRQIVDIVKKSSYVFHENTDLMTVTLVARAVHDKAIGGVSHFGGIGIIKYYQANYGINNLGEYISAAINGYRVKLNVTP